MTGAALYTGGLSIEYLSCVEAGASFLAPCLIHKSILFLLENSSTGDELIEGNQPLQPGQIRDSNRFSLLALLERDGFETVDFGLIPDSESSIEKTIHEAGNSCDALVTTGGVSMGDYDFVKVVLNRVGEMRWMQVAIKPAKPLAFGTVGKLPVFGLPGNPVSSMVSYELFARPALKKMSGVELPYRSVMTGKAAHDFARRSDGKTHFVRVSADLHDLHKELLNRFVYLVHDLLCGADSV